MSIEGNLASIMGYEVAGLYPSARSALLAWQNVECCEPWFRYDAVSIPSNVCPELRRVLPGASVDAVSGQTGMAPDVPVQMYGYRNVCPGAKLDLDPLMTGCLQPPFAECAIISFGRAKTIDIGGGGALLTNFKWIDKRKHNAKHLLGREYFPHILRDPLFKALQYLHDNIKRRRDCIELWDRHLGDSCIRIPQEQIIPWRVIRRIPKKRDAVVKALRAAGFDAGTNYPPLPGVTDPGAISWGKEVINLWVSEDYDEPRIKAACEIIKRVIG